MAPGGAELLDQPFHIDVPEAESIVDHALQDEIMEDDGDDWTASSDHDARDSSISDIDLLPSSTLMTMMTCLVLVAT